MAARRARGPIRHARPGKLDALVRELGDRASAGTPESSAAFGEVVLLAVPLAATVELGRVLGSHIGGKVVLDAGNAFAQRDRAAVDVVMRHAAGSSGWVAAHLSGARVMKAFNTVYYRTLSSEAGRGDDRVGIPLAGDDPEALEIAAALVRDAGFTPVTVGKLAEGKRFEPGTPVYNTGMRASVLAKALPVG